MKFLQVILLALVLHWAAAAPQGKIEETETEKPVVTILKQINQLNLDGSYTYGFEASDGTFRVETRDIKGNVKGKYGYLDEFGEVKTVEYAAGKDAGFNAHGHHIPVPAVPVTSSRGNVDDEFGTDEDWSSVDADEDGIPDPPRPKELRGTPVTKSAAPASTQAAPAGPVVIPGLPQGIPPGLLPQVGPNQRLIAIPFGGPVPPGFRLLNPGAGPVNVPQQARAVPFPSFA